MNRNAWRKYIYCRCSGGSVFMQMSHHPGRLVFGLDEPVVKTRIPKSLGHTRYQRFIRPPVRPSVMRMRMPAPPSWSSHVWLL